MTIQLQPPVALAAAYPIRLVSFLSSLGSTLTSPTVSLRAEEGPQKRGGVLSVTLGAQAGPETRDWGAGLPEGRGGVSGREEWRKGKRKSENRTEWKAGGRL